MDEFYAKDERYNYAIQWISNYLNAYFTLDITDTKYEKLNFTRIKNKYNFELTKWVHHQIPDQKPQAGLRRATEFP